LIFSFKALGGGMRQAGVLAAAAHVALERVEERLWADHENAKIILKGFIFIWSYT
jgi:threonine aldolase